MTACAALAAALRAFRSWPGAWRPVAAAAVVLLAGDAATAVARVLLRDALLREVAGLAIGWVFVVPMLLGVVYASLPRLAKDRSPGIADCWRLGAARYGTAWKAILGEVVVLCGACAILAIVDLPAYAVRPLGWFLLVPWTAVVGLFTLLALWVVVPLVFMEAAGFGRPIPTALRLCGSRWAPLLGLALGCAVPAVPLAWVSVTARSVPVLGPVVDALVGAGLQVFVALVAWLYVRSWQADGSSPGEEVA